MVVKIPVTVATGFLGSGKTTLINHLLANQQGRKIAVIENEYGEISIDTLLVKQQVGTSEEIFELPNGCLCCRVRGDLIRALTKILQRKAAVDAILIETTGLADPAPVAQTFFTDDNLKEKLELDAILTVIDAKHCLQHIHKENADGIVNEAVQQIAFADVLLLNKVDLVSEKEKAEVLRTIKGINSQARVTECTLASAPPDIDKLLGLGAFNLDRILEMDASFLEESQDKHEHREEHHSQSHAHNCAEEHPGQECPEQSSSEGMHGHHHDPGVSSVAIQMEGSVNPRALNEWLGQLLQERGPDLFRSKGVLCFEGDTHKTVFQGVHDMFSFSEQERGKPLQAGEKPLNKLVFIGRHLDKAELTAAFKACLVEM